MRSTDSCAPFFLFCRARGGGVDLLFCHSVLLYHLMSMISGPNNNILAKPTNINGKITNDYVFHGPLLDVKINPLY